MRKKIIFIIISLLVLGGIWGEYRILTRMRELEAREELLEKRNRVLYMQVAELEGQISEYQETLREANDNIEQANAMIDQARMNSWTTYEEMGDALNSLELVDTVSEP